jgi:uncharacterized protein (DUF305 family)
MNRAITILGISASLGLAALSYTGPARADADMPMDGMHDTHEMSGGAKPQGDSGPASLALSGANAKMHEAMAIEYSGDADVDFARGMIPHHQGAIDMAKIALAFGKDPEIRRLAEEIVKAQEAEIAFMQAWLKKQGR